MNSEDFAIFAETDKPYKRADTETNFLKNNKLIL